MRYLIVEDTRIIREVKCNTGIEFFKAESDLAALQYLLKGCIPDKDINDEMPDNEEDCISYINYINTKILKKGERYLQVFNLSENRVLYSWNDQVHVYVEREYQNEYEWLADDYDDTEYENSHDNPYNEDSDEDYYDEYNENDME